MKVKVKELLALMEKRGLTAADLARECGVSVSEIETLLGGGAVGIETARPFVYYLGTDTAQGLVDWAAIGKVNPLACDDESDGEGGEL